LDSPLLRLAKTKNLEKNGVECKLYFAKNEFIFTLKYFLFVTFNLGDQKM